MAATLDLLGMASNMTQDLPAARMYYTEAIDAFRALDDRRSLASSLLGLAEHAAALFHETVPFPVASDDVALEQAELALKLARENGWRSGEAYAQGILGMCLGSRGEFGQALASLTRAWRQPRRSSTASGPPTRTSAWARCIWTCWTCQPHERTSSACSRWARRSARRCGSAWRLSCSLRAVCSEPSTTRV